MKEKDREEELIVIVASLIYKLTHDSKLRDRFIKKALEEIKKRK